MYSVRARRLGWPPTPPRFPKPSTPSSKKRDAAAATTPMAWRRPPACSFRSRARRPTGSRPSGNRWSSWSIRRIPRIRCCCDKPTNRIAHAGGERIKPGSPEEAALRAWIDRLTQLTGDELAKALKYREEEAAGAGSRAAANHAAPPDAQPVQPHGARPAGRPQPARQPVPARRFRQRFQEPVRRRRAFRRC